MEYISPPIRSRHVVRGFRDFDDAKTFSSVAHARIVKALKEEGVDPQGLSHSVESPIPSNGKTSSYDVNFSHPHKNLTQLLELQIREWATTRSLTPMNVHLRLGSAIEAGGGLGQPM